MSRNAVEKELKFAAWNVEDIVTHRSPRCKEQNDGTSFEVGQLYWVYLIQFYCSGCCEFKTALMDDIGLIRKVNFKCAHCEQISEVTIRRVFNISHRLFKDYLKQMRASCPCALVVERKEEARKS